MIEKNIIFEVGTLKHLVLLLGNNTVYIYNDCEGIKPLGGPRKPDQAAVHQRS